MSKPVLYKINAFDATTQNTLSFSYVDTIGKVEAFFYNNETGALVNQINYITQKNELVIPANTLENSTVAYNVKIRIYATSSSTEASAWSDPVLFYCVSAPVLALKDLSATEINSIDTSSYKFEVSYDAGAQNELLSSFYYVIYSANKSQISKTDTYYSSDATFTYNSLDNYTGYYIRVIGESKHGFQLDTGYVSLYVEYADEKTYANITAQNRPKVGDVALSISMVSIEGEAFDSTGMAIDDDKVVYVDGFSGYAADLMATGDYIVFENGYKGTSAMAIPRSPYAITGDFNGSVRFMPMETGGKVLTLKTKSGSSVIELYFANNDEQVYSFLHDTVSGYYVESNYLTRDITKWITVYIKRESGLYTLTMKEMSDE